MVLQGNDVALRDVTTITKPIRVCITHGAKVKEGIKRCSFEGCTKKARKEGVCSRHYSKITNNDGEERCIHGCCSFKGGCTKKARKGGKSMPKTLIVKHKLWCNNEEKTMYPSV